MKHRIRGQVAVSDHAVYFNEKRLDPERSQKVINHSPDGFNWGYGGSGPSQLALALLLEAGFTEHIAVKFYQDFKWDYVSKFEQDKDFDVWIDFDLWIRERRLNHGV